MEFPPGARINGDGSVTFPMRGKPPVCNHPDYEEDPNDGYRWILKYCPCKHRQLSQSYTCISGKTRTRDFCPIFGIGVNPRFCNIDCKEVKI